ncbi:hypothetical protein [Rhodoferax sp.]|uniref:hypothetical protein n=1 Tax=Rhodoferax sp. TaxID=50421 RepID=UPI00374CF1E9
MATETLAERMLFLVHATTQEHRRYKELEEKTGVAADRWKAFALGRQRPTAEMIEALGKLKPQYSQWLLTGKVDPIWFDQVDPTSTESEERALSNYADTLYELATGMQPGLKAYLKRIRPEFWKTHGNDPKIKLLKEIDAQGHATEEQIKQLKEFEENENKTEIGKT